MTASQMSHLPDEVDEVAVERAVRGERLRLNRAERLEVFRLRCSYAQRMTGWGLSARMIAEKLGVTERHVFRYRAMGVAYASDAA